MIEREKRVIEQIRTQSNAPPFIKFWKEAENFSELLNYVKSSDSNNAEVNSTLETQLKQRLDKLGSEEILSIHPNGFA